MICPVCGKKFQLTEKNKFLIGNEYTCCWECFSNNHKRKQEQKKKAQQEKQKRKQVAELEKQQKMQETIFDVEQPKKRRGRKKKVDSLDVIETEQVSPQ